MFIRASHRATCFDTSHRYPPLFSLPISRSREILPAWETRAPSAARRSRLFTIHSCFFFLFISMRRFWPAVTCLIVSCANKSDVLLTKRPQPSDKPIKPSYHPFSRWVNAARLSGTNVNLKTRLAGRSRGKTRAGPEHTDSEE
ncbi:hypothetical protein RRG08_052118 [Elysia crispata]|uniref:Uncharacterized protein n=1 Tax=Elysia crispata TaxID=231223 RepID=A0AAE1A5T0_9GAST|nr:hypothetical protein RRG08_052118 [Elysia crispata]